MKYATSNPESDAKSASKLATQDQIAQSLTAFKLISKKDISCPQCGYKGAMGFVSNTFKNFFTILGIIGSVAALIVMIFASFSWGAAFAGVSLFNFFKGMIYSNKFECPRCKLHQLPRIAAQLNPMSKV
jgi:DNA-directed RNA polymerase subunit RPC12/RpoP